MDFSKQKFCNWEEGRRARPVETGSDAFANPFSSSKKVRAYQPLFRGSENDWCPPPGNGRLAACIVRNLKLWLTIGP